MLATVERSPAAPAHTTATAWVDVFTPDGRIEDPVGSQPHAGARRSGASIDTFIGPRDITMPPRRRHRGRLHGDPGRELEVEVASALTMRVPIYLRYDLQDDAGELKIAALYGLLGAAAMVGQFLRRRSSAVPPGLNCRKGC